MNTLKKVRSAAVAPIIALLAMTLFAPLSFAASPSSGHSDPIATMAQMLSEINHYPSAEQKETLKGIKENESSSNATQAIAQAIHDLEHKAQSEDVAELEEIAEDSSASGAEKQLANVLLNFNHKADAEAQKTLKELSKH